MLHTAEIEQNNQKVVTMVLVCSNKYAAIFQVFYFAMVAVFRSMVSVLNLI